MEPSTAANRVFQHPDLVENIVGVILEQQPKLADLASIARVNKTCHGFISSQPAETWLRVAQWPAWQNCTLAKDSSDMAVPRLKELNAAVHTSAGAAGGSGMRRKMHLLQFNPSEAVPFTFPICRADSPNGGQPEPMAAWLLSLPGMQQLQPAAEPRPYCLPAQDAAWARHALQFLRETQLLSTKQLGLFLDLSARSETVTRGEPQQGPEAEASDANDVRFASRLARGLRVGPVGSGVYLLCLRLSRHEEILNGWDGSPTLSNDADLRVVLACVDSATGSVRYTDVAGMDVNERSCEFDTEDTSAVSKCAPEQWEEVLDLIRRTAGVDAGLANADVVVLSMFAAFQAEPGDALRSTWTKPGSASSGASPSGIIEEIYAHLDVANRNVGRSDWSKHMDQSTTKRTISDSGPGLGAQLSTLLARWGLLHADRDYDEFVLDQPALAALSAPHGIAEADAAGVV